MCNKNRRFYGSNLLSIGYILYTAATEAGAPLIRLLLARRKSRGKEDPVRLAERKGTASRPRPPGPLIWFHAASVGESVSVLLLIEKLAETLPQTSFLVTTGTVTSAQIMAQRLPPRAIHQYAPVDRLPWVRRFLDHWRPDLALWVESELWPHLVREVGRRGVPAALLNARLSEKSFRNWQRFPSFIRELLASFDLCMTQTDAAQERFRLLGARAVTYVGNLKYAAQPLPHDATKLENMRQMVGERPLWLFASSHAGEEGIALAAHQTLSAEFPNILTIIAPRHPNRAPEIERLLTAHGVTCTRHSTGKPVTETTQIYLADTLGEMGLFYRLADIVCVGGSFTPVGGHNPIEPALLNCAILFGPLMSNVTEVAHQMIQAQAAQQVMEGQDLITKLRYFLNNKQNRVEFAEKALRVATNNQHVLKRVIATLSPLLKKAGCT